MNSIEPTIAYKLVRRAQGLLYSYVATGDLKVHYEPGVVATAPRGTGLLVWDSASSAFAYKPRCCFAAEFYTDYSLELWRARVHGPMKLPSMAPVKVWGATEYDRTHINQLYLAALHWLGVDSTLNTFPAGTLAFQHVTLLERVHPNPPEENYA